MSAADAGRGAAVPTRQANRAPCFVVERVAPALTGRGGFGAWFAARGASQGRSASCP